MRHGSRIDPPNRFEQVHREADLAHFDLCTDEIGSDDRDVVFMEDDSRSIVSENDSPDVPFRFSLNPYRGCMHGCAYCYARNTHEYLGYSAGLDFETKIIVKPRAPELFREYLCRKGWKGELIAFSGVTDCYQPCERRFGLTRSCLEIALEARQQIGIVTKNALVLRDLDLLHSLAEKSLVHVFLSINSLNNELARDMEPRTSIPSARLRAVSQLAQAGIPVGVIVAPIVPGLNDHEVAEVLQAARDAGAMAASFVVLRLPLTVEPVFLEWLERTQPSKARKVQSLIRHTRQGKLNQSQFRQRMKGTGHIAEQIGQMFHVVRDRLDFPGLPDLDGSLFRPPLTGPRQLMMFE
jgi:DNA repair photolyase